jgi:tripartite ATP-independent transporter DctP family solute receptor
MRCTWFGVVLAVFALASVVAVPAMAGEPTYELKFNTVGVPTQPEYKAMEVFAKNVEALSAGKIKARLFHSGQLGDQKTQMTKVQRGTLEMSFADGTWLSEFIPEMGVFGAAYLYRDLDHMYRVMTGPVGHEYFEMAAKKISMRPLDVWYLGTRQLNLRTKAVTRPEDMKDVKLRVPNNPMWIAMGKALGANPTPLGFGELYLALKTGTVDGQDNPLPTNETAKFYEVTKYIVMTSHVMGQLWPIIHEPLWQGMPAEYKQWIRMSLLTARHYMNHMVLEGEATLLEKFEKQYGLKITYPDLEPWRKAARPAYKEFESKWGAGVYEKIQTAP